MTLAHGKVRLLVALLSIALAGLLAVQGHLLAQTYRARRQAFDRNVTTALNAVARSVEKEEVARRTGILVQEHLGRLDTLRVRQPVDRFFGAVCPDSLGMAVLDLRDELHHYVRSDAADPDTLLWRGLQVRPVLGSGGGTAARIVVEGPDEAHRMVFVMDPDKTDLVGRVFGDLSGMETRPVAERIDPARLDSLLDAELERVGIDTRAEFAVAPTGADTLALVSDPSRADALRASPYRASLFPLDLRPPFYELMVDLPAARAFVWRSMAPVLAATLAFAALIVAAFSRALRTILVQRRLTARTVDFINNMTHEFKTPLATIALAREALARGDVQSDPGAVRRYLDMIRDENARMHGQVEKILQMAHLEAGDIALTRVDVDLHDLVRDAAGALALQAEERGGELELRLEARRPRVRGDAVHLRGVIVNLLDNALKYSPDAPRITVATRDDGLAVLLTVADRGIGVPAADRTQAFEKYYRCPTGNRHDVKGFGLGLSYVKLMTEAHGGSVSLHDRRGGGTEVRVRLPALRQEGVNRS